MPNVIGTHAVGNIETWLAGGEERAAIFKTFCTGYRIYRHRDQAKVSVVWENVDMAKLQTALAQPGTAVAMTKHTVIQPVEVFVEVEGGR